MQKDKIIIKGAREHNLKNIDLEIPREKLIVFTGLSGSGKSSLAFDTIYADGQRRYIESLSSYARQFLGQMEKPDVDSIEGLSPAISTIRKPLQKTRGLLSELSLKFTIIFGCFMPESESPTALSAAVKSNSRPLIQIVDQIFYAPARQQTTGSCSCCTSAEGRACQGTGICQKKRFCPCQS